MPYGSVAAELFDTVQALKGVFGSGTDFSNEQIDFIAKTFGISSGFQPYDLSAAAYYLQPVFSPFRNRMPRLHLQGRNMEFKSVTNVDTGDASGVMGEGLAPASIATQFADVTTQFKAYGLRSDPVTFEELYAAVGKAGDFNVDARAVAVANLLKALFVKEERLILGGVGATAQVSTSGAAPANGLNFTIGGAMGNAPAGGSLAASTTGGSIAASTAVYGYYTAVTACAIPTGMPTTSGSLAYATSNAGESLPQSSEMSVTTGSGTSTNSLTFTPPNYSGPAPVIGWKLYLGATGAEKYAGFTTGAPLVITAVPSTGATVPSADSSAVTSVSGGTGSSVEGMFNGILAWLYGTGSGATIQQVNGAITLAAINAALSSAFATAFADPDALWVAAQDMPKFTSIVIGNSSGQPYFFAAPQGDAQGDVTGNFKVARYLNPVTGKRMPVNVHAYLPQGTALALTDQLPPWYVGNNVPDVWVWGGNMDYLELDLQPSPNYRKFVTDLQCVGAIHCFLPSQNVVLSGIA